MNVGLNELESELPQKGTVRYRVQYWRWTAFAVGACGLLGLIGLLLILATDEPASLRRSMRRPRRQGEFVQARGRSRTLFAVCPNRIFRLSSVTTGRLLY